MTFESDKAFGAVISKLINKTDLSREEAKEAFSTVLKNETTENLQHQMDKLSKDYDALFSVSENYVLSFREYLEENLTLEILKDDEKSKETLDKLIPISTNAQYKKGL